MSYQSPEKKFVENRIVRNAVAWLAGVAFIIGLLVTHGGFDNIPTTLFILGAGVLAVLRECGRTLRVDVGRLSLIRAGAA